MSAGIMVLSIVAVLIIAFLLAKYFPGNPDRIDWD